MSANNPSITASDIVTQVESRIDGSDLSTADYLPWISYAYQQVYLAITDAGKTAKEYYFGDSETFNLVAGTSEYSLSTNIPRFGGITKVEIKYGDTNDDWVTARPLQSRSNWNNFGNVSTSYRSKSTALYYVAGDTIGFIPTPPTSDSGTPQARVFYIKRPYQITEGGDVIDLPYRYMWAIDDYVQSKAIEATNEDYSAGGNLELRFREKLARITDEVETELGEYAQSSIMPTTNRLTSNPMRRT